MKPLLLRLLTSILGLCVVTISQGADFTENGIGYTILDSSAKTVEVCESFVHENVVIPATTTQGYKVIRVGEWAFRDSNAKTVELPNTVVSIGDYAFAYAQFLTSVTGANSVRNLGQSAFYKCGKLSKVTISSSVTEIKANTFCDCESLTDVTIPNSVTVIGDNAFRRCKSLTYVAIPNSVTRIGNYGFGSCSKLASISLPRSIVKLGEGAFAYCSLSILVVPDQLQELPPYCFGGNALKEVVIGRNLQKIERSAFSIDGRTSFIIRCFAEIPPKCDFYAFNDYSTTVMYENYELYVPIGSKALYERRHDDEGKTSGWWRFEKIYDTLESSGIESTNEDINTPTIIGAVDMQGRSVDKDASGMVILRYSDGSVKKIVNK